MSTTTINIPDKTYKYPFCYGILSGLMVGLQGELDCAKRYGRPIDMERIEWFLAQYRAVDDALNATFKT